MPDALKPYIAQVAKGQALSRSDAEAAFHIIMAGEATEAQIGGLLMAMRVRGETADELTGAAQAMRAFMSVVKAPADAIDLVGTGGDGAHTLNISTAAAFVTAACGLPVAKHGNRSVSSKSGASDVLTALGINVDIAIDRIADIIAASGMGFMLAPKHHLAIRHVMPVRIQLATPTLFNILGPLANPARTQYQLLGVFSADLVDLMSQALANLGMQRAWVVHGNDGLDEITLTDTTQIAKVEQGRVEKTLFDPRSLGYQLCQLSDLQGGSPQDNAIALRAILEGARNPYAETVELNAGAALVIGGKVKDMAEGAAKAREALSSGAALRVLETLRRLTQDA